MLEPSTAPRRYVGDGSIATRSIDLDAALSEVNGQLQLLNL
jgi:hypothetical protein